MTNLELITRVLTAQTPHISMKGGEITYQDSKTATPEPITMEQAEILFETMFFRGRW